MKAKPAFVAIDLGAESGRVVLGRLEGGAVRLDEVEPVPEPARELPDGLHWNVTSSSGKSLAGIGLAGQASSRSRHRRRFVGASTTGCWTSDDTTAGAALSLPRPADRGHGRAGRRAPVAEPHVPGHRHPVHADQHGLPVAGRGGLAGPRGRSPHSPHPRSSELLALRSDGQRTDGGLDDRTAGRAQRPVGARRHQSARAAGAHLLGLGLVDPGTVLGPLLADHATALGLPEGVPVIATAAHDTAAAFAGVPRRRPGAAVLSSGTWSLLGLEVDSPVLTEAARPPACRTSGACSARCACCGTSWGSGCCSSAAPLGATGRDAAQLRRAGLARCVGRTGTRRCSTRTTRRSPIQATCRPRSRR